MSIYRQMIMNRPMMKLMEEFLSQPSQEELFSPKGLERLIKTGRVTMLKNQPIQEPDDTEQISSRRSKYERK